MKEQLTIEHLSAYLPYGVQMKLDRKVVWHPNNKEKPNIQGADATLTVSLLADIIEGAYDSMAKFKPILRPISDLTKEIGHDGQKFVPMEIINSLSANDLYYCKTEKRDRFDCDDGNWYGCTELPYDVIQKLLSCHFDIFGLIEKNLAIDINTLDKEVKP